MIRGSIQRPNIDSEGLGLKDGGHITFQCSNCNAFLCDIWINKADVNQEWRGRATCPFCGDKSYEQTWKGLFAIGGIAADEEGRLFLPVKGDKEGITSTTLGGFDEGEDGLLIIKINRAPNGKPVTKK